MRRLILATSLVCLLLTTSGVTQEQQKLTNNDVVQMLSMGLAPEVVIEKIHATPTAFDTGLEALKSLKDAGVPDAVLKAMISPSAGSVGDQTPT